MSHIAAPAVWDCWPDGNFRTLFSIAELNDTNQLAVNWILDTISSRGSAKALTWQKEAPEPEEQDVQNDEIDDEEQWEIAQDPDANEDIEADEISSD
ncbi:hypothetical protein C8R43DRAFT_1131341 [Mycena crocata]|nr:hypothetical protein C8R43DRAFT_1131341 [Mycena crocata]